MKQGAEEYAGFKVKDLQFLDGASNTLYLRGLKVQVTGCLAPAIGETEIVVWDESVVGFVGPEKQHVLLEEV